MTASRATRAPRTTRPWKRPAAASPSDTSTRFCPWGARTSPPIGAASNTVGTIFTATGSGSGSGQAVDLTLTAKYAMYIDNKSEVGLSDTNQDGFIESFLINGNNMDWWGQFDSTLVADGSVNVHYVIFDNAGNASHYVQSAYISNHAPQISNVVLGTDLNGDADHHLLGSRRDADVQQRLRHHGLHREKPPALLPAQHDLRRPERGPELLPEKQRRTSIGEPRGPRWWATRSRSTSARSRPTIPDATGNGAQFVLKVTDSTPGGGQPASVTDRDEHPERR